MSKTFKSSSRVSEIMCLTVFCYYIPLPQTFYSVKMFFSKMSVEMKDFWRSNWAALLSLVGSLRESLFSTIVVILFWWLRVTWLGGQQGRTAQPPLGSPVPAAGSIWCAPHRCKWFSCTASFAIIISELSFDPHHYYHATSETKGGCFRKKLDCAIVFLTVPHICRVSELRRTWEKGHLLTAPLSVTDAVRWIKCLFSGGGIWHVFLGTSPSFLSCAFHHKCTIPQKWDVVFLRQTIGNGFDANDHSRRRQDEWAHVFISSFILIFLLQVIIPFQPTGLNIRPRGS